MGLSVPVKIAVCENLGYPDEKIVVDDLLAPPLPDADLYSLVIGHFGDPHKKVTRQRFFFSGLIRLRQEENYGQSDQDPVQLPVFHRRR